MNRFAALILSTAILGTGCIIDDDDDDFHDGRDFVDVIVYWDFVRNAPAQPRGEVIYDPYDVGDRLPPGLCGESDVDTVEIETPVETFVLDCVQGNGVQGVTLVGMPRGTYDYTITGWRGDVAAYRSTFTITADVDGQEFGLDVAGVSAPIDLFAYFFYGPGSNDYYRTCTEATNPDVFFEVYDSLGTLILDDAAGCPAGRRADPLPVFAGDLDLDDYDVRMAGYNQASQLIFTSCTWEFDHFDPLGQVGAFGVAISLDTPPTPACGF